MLQIFACLALIYITHAEPPPLRTDAPYAAAGWRPDIPFTLPNEYLPPQEFVAAQRRAPISIEISKERVDFAGQITDHALVRKYQPLNANLLPDSDLVNVQALPNAEGSTVFRLPQTKPTSQQTHNEPNPRPIYVRPQQQQIFFPSVNPTAKPNQSAQPAAEYGAPIANNGFSADNSATRAQVQPDDSGAEDDDDVAADILPNRNTAIEALKAAIDAYYAALAQYNAPSQAASIDDETDERAQYNKVNEGRYYILTPENTLQRVVYNTVRDVEDRQSNGFTAQLKYATVGEIKDPIYKYNNEGQLVRILK